MSTPPPEEALPSEETLPDAPDRNHRRRLILMSVSAVVVVLAAFAVMVLVRLSQEEEPVKDKGQVVASDAQSHVISSVTSVPAEVLNSVGKGEVLGFPTMLSDQPPLASNGKPLVIYMGAEFCPFCATTRWPMVVALSRFGKFSDLSVTHSASDDVFPNTATLSFHGVTYTSQYLEFQGVELKSNVRQGDSYALLDKPTELQQQIMSKYDGPPYLKTKAGAIPFADFGNLGILAGSTYLPKLLEGKSATQIVDSLTDPSDPIAQAIDGSANLFTALICRLTNNQPGEVCNSPAVAANQEVLDAPKK